VRGKRRVTGAAAGFLTSVGLLVAGVAINVILIAVAGFVIMLGCGMWAVTSYRRMTSITPGHVSAKGRRAGKNRRAARDRRGGKQAGSGLMVRLRSAGSVASRAAAEFQAARSRPAARTGDVMRLPGSSGMQPGGSSDSLTLSGRSGQGAAIRRRLRGYWPHD
jgi:hypothetical protein